MINNDELFLDAKSGISIEEQKEILTQINTIAEKNKKTLSKGEKNFMAKKRGIFFPLAFNIIAIVVLGFGIFFLILSNKRVDLERRTGSAVYNLTERALIEEIRKETAQRIADKEAEISNITMRLSEVDAQLMDLHSSNEELTAEQLAVQGRLLALQLAYREELSVLQEERAQILEVSRSREAALRAQLDERSREFAAYQRIASGELDAARSELERLSAEQDKVAALEALIANLNISGSVSNSDVIAQNTRLENTIAEMQKTIDAFSLGSSGQAVRLLELEDNLRALGLERDSLSQSVSSRDSTIRELELSVTNQTLEINNLRNQLEIIRQALLE